REVQALGFPLLIGQDLPALDRRSARGDGPSVRLTRGQIPATYPAVERMRGGPEPEISATRPVGGIMTRAQPVATRVRDLVETIAASRKAHVGKQVLFGVALVVRRRGGAARDPAGRRGPHLDSEPVERETS